MAHAKYGKLPSGKRLEKILKSVNYRNGRFQNVNITPEITEGYSFVGVTYEFMFKRHPARKPPGSIPSIKTDLLHLTPVENILVWFGHSSYFIWLDGKSILVDPVFSGNASPVRGTNRAFSGTDLYTVTDLPEIDYLFITHDHYDHVDYETIIKLKPKIKKVICGLGVGSHFEHWGYNIDDIMESDWNEQLDLGDGFTVFTKPARHFSGRGISRNKSLWLSYVLQTPSMKIYIGGDSGYDTHFAEIGQKHGPIDLAILDNGQYDKKWKYIHLLPEEVIRAAKDLKARKMFPVHSSKFAMANHSWDEPLSKVSELSKGTDIILLTPMIGEKVLLKSDSQRFTQWWKDVK